MCKKEITTDEWTNTDAAGYPTQVMAVDLLGPLPESLYVVVVGDYYSKWMEALPVQTRKLQL